MIRVPDEVLERCAIKMLKIKHSYIERLSDDRITRNIALREANAVIQEYETWKITGKRPVKALARAAVLPENWIMPEQWLKDAEEKLKSFGLPPINLLIEAEKFTNWGKQNPKKNWHLTWINWILPKDTVKLHRPPPSSYRSLPETATEQRVRTSRELTDLIARKIEDEGIDRLDNTGNSGGNANYVSPAQNNQRTIGSRIEGTGSDLFEVSVPGNRGNQQG